MKGELIHDAKWQSASDLVDRDGTLKDICHAQILSNDILPIFMND